MKTLKLLVIGMMLMFAGSAQSQLSINVHIGTPPAWGPAGYNDVHYYYLPDIESYYDVQSSMFIYYSGNRWIHSRNLPGRYKNYDLYGGYKVPMSGYRGNTPYTYFKSHKMKYAKGYRGHEQHNIGNRDNNQKNVNQRNNKNAFHNYDKGQVRNNEKNNNRGNDKNKNEKHDNGNDNRK